MQEDINQSRFELADKDTDEMLELVRDKWFEHLKTAKIKILYDLKQRMRGQKLILGRIMKANDLLKRLTDHFYPGGCDYILFLDKIAYQMVMHDSDRKRLIRHELRHCIYNPELSDPWKTLQHDIEDFECEIMLNQDNPGWAKRIVQVTMDVYAQQKEQGKKKRGRDSKENVVLMEQRKRAVG